MHILEYDWVNRGKPRRIIVIINGKANGTYERRKYGELEGGFTLYRYYKVYGLGPEYLEPFVEVDATAKALST